MSKLVGKRFQINLTLGSDAMGNPSFEIAANEIDAGSVKTMPADVGMQMLHRALGMYMQILASQLPQEPESKILIPTGKVPGLRAN